MTTINKANSRLRRLVSSQHTVVIDDVVHTVYDLMLLNSADIELLHSTIEHVTQNFSDKKWTGPTIFIKITVCMPLVNVPLLLYLNAHNFQDFGRSTKDYGDGGKVNRYCVYVNHPFVRPTPTITNPSESTSEHAILSLDLADFDLSSSSMEWVDPLSPLNLTDSMPPTTESTEPIEPTIFTNDDNIDSNSDDDELAIKLFGED